MRAVRRLYYSSIRAIAQNIIEPLLTEGLPRKAPAPYKPQIVKPNWARLNGANVITKHNLESDRRITLRKLSFFKRYTLRAMRLPALHLIDPIEIIGDDNESLFDLLDELDAARSLDSIDTVISEDASSDASGFTTKSLDGISTVKSYFESSSGVSSPSVSGNDEISNAFQRFGHAFPQRAGIGDMLLENYRSLSPSN